jgi:hypothetical protein
VTLHLATIEPKDLAGCIFLKYACVVQAIVDREVEWKKGHEYMKFICEVPASMVDDIFTYNEILDHIERDNNDLDNDTE